MVWRWREPLLRRNALPRGLADGDGDSSEVRALRRKTHQTIARITEDFEGLHFNTSVAALMELSNALGDFSVAPERATTPELDAVREALEALVLMLAPFAPHIAEEMWEGLGHQGGLLLRRASADGGPWPRADEELARREELEIPVQVNGKLRGRIRATSETPEETLRAAALADEKVRGWVDGREIVKVIVVPQRLVNIVIRERTG
jgi:leucyl-tRNA synthetase